MEESVIGCRGRQGGSGRFFWGCGSDDVVNLVVAKIGVGGDELQNPSDFFENKMDLPETSCSKKITRSGHGLNAPDTNCQDHKHLTIEKLYHKVKQEQRNPIQSMKR
jgi:hypothetical protein